MYTVTSVTVSQARVTGDQLIQTGSAPFSAAVLGHSAPDTGSEYLLQELGSQMCI